MENDFNAGDLVYSEWSIGEINAYTPLKIVGFYYDGRTGKVSYNVCKADENETERELVRVCQEILKPYDERTMKEDRKRNIIYNCFILFLFAVIIAEFLILKAR